MLVLYNFFFLPPVGTFSVLDPQNVVALTVFLCASFLVSHLSTRARREAELAEVRRREVQHLYEFSQELLLHDDLSSVARITPSIAATIFGFRAVALYVRGNDAAYYSDPGYELVPLADLKIAAESIRARRHRRPTACRSFLWCSACARWASSLFVGEGTLKQYL